MLVRNKDCIIGSTFVFPNQYLNSPSLGNSHDHNSHIYPICIDLVGFGEDFIRNRMENMK